MTPISRKLALLIVPGIALLVWGCTPSAPEKKGEGDKPELKDEELGGLTPEEAAKVVAKVGDVEITVGEVTNQINRMSPFIRQRFNSPEKRKEFVEKLVRMELLAAEAESQGLQDDPDVERAVNQAMIRLYTKKELEKKVLPSEVADAEVKKYYDEHSHEFNKPDQVRVSIIVLKTKEEAEEMLRRIKEKEDDPRFFREMARKNSIDNKSKTRGGDLRYYPKFEELTGDEPPIDKAILDAAWLIKEEGKVYPKVVETDKGFVIVKVTNKKKAVIRKLENIRRIIENRLLREKRREAMDAYLKKLREEADIKVYDKNLDLVQIEVPRHPHSHGPMGKTKLRRTKAPVRKTKAPVKQ